MGHYDACEADRELVVTDNAVVLKQDSTGQICVVLKNCPVVMDKMWMDRLDRSGRFRSSAQQKHT